MAYDKIPFSVFCHVSGPVADVRSTSDKSPYSVSCFRSTPPTERQMRLRVGAQTSTRSSASSYVDVPGRLEIR